MGKEKSKKAGRDFSSALPAVILALASFITFLAYAPARTMTFYFDDRVTILHNEKVQSDNWIEVISENPFRALVNLTFSTQHKIHSPKDGKWPKKLDQVINNITSEVTSVYGESERLRGFLKTGPQTSLEKNLTPVSIDRERALVFPLPPARPFRLFNLMVHFLNAFLLYLVVKRIGIDKKIAVIAAVIFMVHPLCTEPVNYITARFSLMALTFSLLSVFAHLRADDNPRNDVLAAIYFIAALFCKENAVVLPAVVFLLDFARGKPRYRVLYALLISITYIVLRSGWLVVLTARPDELLNSLDYFMVSQRIFWLYAIKVFCPLHLNFDYHVIPSFKLDLFFTVFNPLLFLCAGVLVVLKMNQVFKQRMNKKEGTDSSFSTVHWVCAVFLMCVIALLPTSSFIPLGDLVKEDRAYPVLAILIPAVVCGLLPRLFQDRPGVLKYAAAVVIAFFLALTGSRNLDWRSGLDLGLDTYTKSPEKPRAVYNYAQALKWNNQLEKSRVYFYKVLEMEPDNKNAMINVRAINSHLSNEKD